MAKRKKKQTESDYTRVTHLKLWAWRVIDALLLFAPVVIYAIFALADGNITTTGKVSVVSSVFMALILCIVNVVTQKRLRCPIWILLIGLYIALRDSLLPLIIILAITTVADDLVFTPLISYYRTKYLASKTIDERERENGH